MNKFLILSVCILGFHANLSAQITPKSYVVGGRSNFSFYAPADVSITQFNTQFDITPSFGKFTSEKMLWETSMGYSRRRQYFESNDNYFDVISNGISLEIGFTRFFPIVDRLYFTFNPNLQGALSNYATKTNNSGEPTVNKSDSFQTCVVLASGLAYFLNKKWMIYTTVGTFNYTMTFPGNNTIGHTINFSVIGNSFGVGARYILGSDTK